jgi:hypothetical protein
MFKTFSRQASQRSCLELRAVMTVPMNPGEARSIAERWVAEEVARFRKRCAPSLTGPSNWMSDEVSSPPARRLTQRFVRHKSILTTAVYSHPTDEDLHRAVDGMAC